MSFRTMSAFYHSKSSSSSVLYMLLVEIIKQLKTAQYFCYRLFTSVHSRPRSDQLGSQQDRDAVYPGYCELYQPTINRFVTVQMMSFVDHFKKENQFWSASQVSAVGSMSQFELGICRFDSLVQHILSVVVIYW